MAAGHVMELDELVAAELAKQIGLAEAVDDDIGQRGLVKPRSGEVRSIIDLRLRISGRIEKLLIQLGLTRIRRQEPWTG